MKTATQVAGKRILLIEDEPDVCKSLSYRLRKLGYHVTITNDGEDGLKKAQDTIPDLIILDLMLPSLPGEEVCRAIREDERPKIQNIPIIMLTAKKKDADRIVGKMLGANSYILKPFEVSDLLTTINRCIA